MCAARNKKRSPGLKEVAALAGVGVATASMALRHSARIASETKEKVRQAAEKLGYRPSAIYREAMAQIRRRSGPTDRDTLVWLGPGRSNSKEPMDVTWQAAAQAAEEHGYRLERHAVTSGEELAALHRQWVARGIRGCIMAPLGPKLHLVGAGHLQGLRVVSLDEGVEPHSGIVRVVSDVETEMLQAMRAVENHGYCRPGLANNPWRDVRHTLRRTFVALYNELGLEGVPPVLNYRSSELDGAQMQEWFSSYKPDCILSDNHDAVDGLGLRTPDDIGFIRLRKEAHEHRLAGSFLPPDQLGRAAVSHLASMLIYGDDWDFSWVGSLLLPPRWEPGETLRHQDTFCGTECRPVFELSETQVRRLHPISLAPWCNQPFRGKYQWFGYQGLHAVQAGDFRGAGVPFQLGGPEGDFVLLRSAKLKRGARGGLPDRVRLSLEGRRAEAVFILHACANAQLKPFASYRLLYADRSVEERAVGCPSGRMNEPIPLEPPLEALVHDWWHEYPIFQSHEVLPVPFSALGNEQLYGVHLYVWRWINPHPAKCLEAIEVISDAKSDTTLGVLGITLLEAKN